MKVYLITSGRYSDYCVNYVKLDREEAEKICAVKNKEFGDNFYDIEEYDTDDIVIDSDIEVKKTYMFSYHYGLRIERPIFTSLDINKLELNDINGENVINGIATFSKSITDEKARKIIQDRVAKFKVEKEGIC